MGTMSGKTVMITGASRGLGRALAAALPAKAPRSPSVRDMARRSRPRRKRAARSASRCSPCSPTSPTPPTSSASPPPPWNASVGSTSWSTMRAVLGPLPLPQLTDAPSSALEHVLQANVLGPLRLTQAVIGGMLLRNRGLVVNISTDAALDRVCRTRPLQRVQGSARRPDAKLVGGAAAHRGPGHQRRPRRHAYRDAHGRRPGGRPGRPASAPTMWRNG